jgi:hypothetical protein
MYIADYYNNRIRKVNSKGIINTIAGDGTGGYFGDGGSATSAEINGPEGVAVDASGNVYIGDAENQRIRKISTTGIITTIAGNGTKGYSGDGGLAANAELYYPDGIAVDDSGSIYIADSYNNRIRKINSTGIISTVIGDGTKGYSGDGGPATVAELNQTSDVFVDASSNIYIADYANNRIRKVYAPLAINEITDSKDLIIYPNPSNGEFNVALKGVTSKNKIEVFNMLGQCVFLNKLNNNLTEINLSNQPAGIYLYKEVSEQEEFISGGKIIIQ